MIYKFYQNILPFNNLIEVGEYDVPDGYREWKIPIHTDVKVIAHDYDITSQNPINDAHTYTRSYIGYIANVEVKHEP